MKLPDWFLPAYALLLTLAAFAFVFYAAFFAVPSEYAERVIDTVTGFLLGSLLAPLVAFFFGSSMGSKDKDRRPNEPAPPTVPTRENLVRVAQTPPPQDPQP